MHQQDVKCTYWMFLTAKYCPEMTCTNLRGVAPHNLYRPYCPGLVEDLWLWILQRKLNEAL